MQPLKILTHGHMCDWTWPGSKVTFYFFHCKDLIGALFARELQHWSQWGNGARFQRQKYRILPLNSCRSIYIYIYIYISQISSTTVILGRDEALSAHLKEDKAVIMLHLPSLSFFSTIFCTVIYTVFISKGKSSTLSLDCFCLFAGCFVFVGLTIWSEGFNVGSLWVLIRMSFLLCPKLAGHLPLSHTVVTSSGSLWRFCQCYLGWILRVSLSHRCQSCMYPANTLCFRHSMTAKWCL